MKDLSELSKKIEEDKGLARSRKYLMFVSLILLALTFSSAKIVEANTFLFTLTFENPQGIIDLLLLSIAFLVVRYYSYASKYHRAIHDDWTEKLLVDEFFYNTFEPTDDEGGYIVDIAPEYAGYNDDEFRHDEYSNCSVSFCANWFVNSQVRYDLHTRDGHVQNKRVYLFNISKFRLSMKALDLVLAYWFKAQVRDSESLDIYAPYMIFFITTFSVVLSKF